MITFFLGPATGYLWLFFSSHWSGWQLQWLNSSVSDCFRTQWTKGLRGIIPTRNSTLLALDNVCRINGNILEAMISTYPVTYIYIHIFTIKTTSSQLISPLYTYLRSHGAASWQRSTDQDVHFGATRAGRELQGFADREREAIWSLGWNCHRFRNPGCLMIGSSPTIYLRIIMIHAANPYKNH